MRNWGDSTIVRHMTDRLAVLNRALAQEGDTARVRYLELAATTKTGRLSWMLHWELRDVPDPVSISYFWRYRDRAENLFDNNLHHINSGFWNPRK